MGDRLPVEFWKILHAEYGIVVYPSALTEDVDVHGVGTECTFTDAYCGHISKFRHRLCVIFRPSTICANSWEWQPCLDDAHLHTRRPVRFSICGNRRQYTRKSAVAKMTRLQIRNE